MVSLKLQTWDCRRFKVLDGLSGDTGGAVCHLQAAESLWAAEEPQHVHLERVQVARDDHGVKRRSQITLSHLAQRSGSNGLVIGPHPRQSHTHCVLSDGCRDTNPIISSNLFNQTESNFHATLDRSFTMADGPDVSLLLCIKATGFRP